MNEPLRVGALARKAGVNVETIRYYQRLGLIETPERPPGGQRGYPPATVGRLQFIRRAQQLGFKLEEIADLLRLQSGVDRASVRRIAGTRLVEIRQRIQDLSRIESVLSGLLDTCAHAPGRHRCPIIEAMTVPHETTGTPKAKSGAKQ
jgi:MerR family transcriptional regulator, mercuric resistance operon regulatory protein